MAKKPYNAHVEMRTCHDIRHFVSCHHCSGVGDRRNMVAMMTGVPNSAKAYFHGRCYIDREGLQAFLRLPEKVTDALTLADIGTDAMKALVEWQK